MTEETYQAAIDTLGKLMANLEKENAKLKKVVKFYAHENWAIIIIDRGSAARQALK